MHNIRAIKIELSQKYNDFVQFFLVVVFEKGMITTNG
jgi:hypothetical protein